MDTSVLRTTTDTAHPQPVVPVYRIHSITAPFCSHPGCWCQQHQARVSALLAVAALGTMRVQEARDNGTDVLVSAD